MRGAWVAVLAVVSSLVAGCTGDEPIDRSRPEDAGDAGAGPTGLSIPAAGWRPGHVFEYELLVDGLATFQLEQAGSTFKDKEPFSEESSQTLEVLSTDGSFGGEPIFLLAVSVDGYEDSRTLETELLRGRSLVAARQSDLQPLATSIHYPDCVAACRPDSLLLEDHPDYYPWLRFPLDDGATWSGDLDGGEALGAMHVESLARVTSAQLGEAHHVADAVLDMETLRDILEGAGATDVRMEATLEGNRTIRYDAGQGTFTSDLFVLDMHQDIHLTTPDGEPARFVVDVHVEVEMRLAEARLTERDDPGMEGVLDGLTLPHMPIPVLTMSLADDDLNAALAPTAHFVLESDTPLDPDHEIDVTLLDPLGDAVDLDWDAEGLEAVLVQPGLYHAEATLSRDGEFLSRAQLQVPVRYEADLSLACPMLVAPEVDACPTLIVPVRPGATSIHVDATSEGVGALALAKLEAADGDGAAASADFSLGKATLEVTDLSAFALDGRDWTVAYKPTVAQGDNVTLHVLVSAAVAAPEPAPSLEQALRTTWRQALPTPWGWTPSPWQG